MDCVRVENEPGCLVTAAALLDAAVEGRAAMRRGEDATVPQLEGQYAQMREAMGWLLLRHSRWPVPRGLP